MNILAIDTSSSACSIALLLDGKIFSEHLEAPMRQAKIILPEIEKILHAHAVKLTDLSAIAFGCGPGSFTGVRIAISVAQGLAFASNLPLISVSSLAALAQGAYEELGWRKILAVVDARINEVYYGAYQVQENNLMQLVGTEVVAAPDKILFPADHDWYGAGNAWVVYRDQLSFQPTQIDAKREPMAKAILSLAQDKFLRSEWVAAGEAVPVYLRDEVAKKAKTK